MATQSSSPSPSPSSEAPSPAAKAAPSPLLILAAILLPPLAIFLAQGVTRDFWIAVALTCLGYLPGVAFALFAVLKRQPAAAAA